MRTVVLALVLVGACACVATPVSVNIHVKLNAAAEQQAIAYDSWCHARLPSDDVWLATINQPHVTLYLTEFEDTNFPQLQQRLDELCGTFRQCAIALNNTVPSGDYGMWNVVNNDCLQDMSDTIVNATCDLITPNQPIPAWVYKLPEPMRSEKIKMIQLYGSPNVFSQFQPHVTLAYDNATAENFDAVFATIPSQPLAAQSIVLGMGRVGNWGTVLRGKDWADWPLASPDTPRKHPRGRDHRPPRHSVGPTPAVGGSAPVRGYQHAKGRRIPIRTAAGGAARKQRN